METTTDGSIHAIDSPPKAQEAEVVIRHLNRSYQASDQVIDREIIDESGDILIQTSSKELLISSKILALASPVFKAMLNSKFLEGITADASALREQEQKREEQRQTLTREEKELLNRKQRQEEQQQTLAADASELALQEQKQEERRNTLAAVADELINQEQR